MGSLFLCLITSWSGKFSSSSEQIIEVLSATRNTLLDIQVVLEEKLESLKEKIATIES